MYRRARGTASALLESMRLMCITFPWDLRVGVAIRQPNNRCSQSNVALSVEMLTEDWFSVFIKNRKEVCI